MPGHRVDHGAGADLSGETVGSATATRDTPSRVGWAFISLYAVSSTGGSLLFLAPLLVSLALKVADLVGIDAAPRNLAMVAGIGSLLAIVANPLFGRLSDRTTSRLGMRRPWMVIGLALGVAGTLVIATAQTIAVVLAGWCICQVFFNATLAAQAAVLPDQVPTSSRTDHGGLSPGASRRSGSRQTNRSTAAPPTTHGAANISSVEWSKAWTR